MALTAYEKVKRWRQRSKKNQAYSPQFMKARRKHYRLLYLQGKIEYADIPKAYRYYKDTRR